MANRTKFTDRSREQFLEVLRTTANISAAARACGVGRRTAYKHRETDPVFAEAWDDAVEEAVDGLEREAWRRAVEGVDRPVMYQGKAVASHKEYSDRMLELLLKAHRPEKYKDRVENQHTGKNGDSLLRGFTNEELICRMMQKLQPRRDAPQDLAKSA